MSTQPSNRSPQPNQWKVALVFILGIVLCSVPASLAWLMTVRLDVGKASPVQIVVGVLLGVVALGIIGLMWYYFSRTLSRS